VGTIDLIADDNIDQATLDVGKHAPQRRPVEGAAGHAAIIVAVRYRHLSTRTSSKRGAYENSLAKTYPDGPDDDAVGRFLVEDKGMLARVSASADMACSISTAFMELSSD
jgi:hypothetical protein